MRSAGNPTFPSFFLLSIMRLTILLTLSTKEWMESTWGLKPTAIGTRNNSAAFPPPSNSHRQRDKPRRHHLAKAFHNCVAVNHEVTQVGWEACATGWRKVRWNLVRLWRKIQIAPSTWWSPWAPSLFSYRFFRKVILRWKSIPQIWADSPLLDASK